MPPTAERKTGRNFRIKHHLVSAWPRDYVVSLDQFRKNDPDVDIDRLIALDAIEPTDDGVTAAVPPPGPENRSVLVDAAGRTLDAHGHDRPDVQGRIPADAHAEMKTAAGEDEAEVPEGAELDIRSRPGQPLHEGVAAAEGQADYSQMRVADLKVEADQRGIDESSSMNKAELIRALKANDRENEGQ